MARGYGRTPGGAPSGTFVPVDTTHAPLAPAASATPGTGTNGASASDHVHPAQDTTPIRPLWEVLTSAEITLPRSHSDDSGSFGSTPASGVEHFTFFRALANRTISTIAFQTAGTAAATSTLARVGLYTVSGSTLTLVASCANKTTFSGTYATQTCTLTASAPVVAGTIYAVGIIQVATTPASLLGGWFNGAFLNGAPLIAGTKSGQTDLMATATSLSNQQFPVYYELS